MGISIPFVFHYISASLVPMGRAEDPHLIDRAITSGDLIGVLH